MFVETGLLSGFFLPGDSLLFTTGVHTAQMHPAVPLSLLLLTVPAAARQDRDDERSVTRREIYESHFERNP